MTTIAICDDEYSICEGIKEILNRHYSDKVNISIFDNAVSFLEYVDKKLNGEVDIAILDVKLKLDDGIEVARYLSKKYPLIKIIFISGYLDSCRRIFEVEPIYFLVKPISEKSLIEATDRAINKVQTEPASVLAVQSKGSIIKLKTANIDYIESEGRIIHIHTLNDVIDIYMKLSEVLAKLPEEFVLCHKSYCVNMKKIIKLGKSEIELYNNECIPVSRVNYQQVKEKYIDFITGRRCLFIT